ncbi:MAG TPA: cyclic peptide export ABC transporter [Xanthobacteraceae bacterium]|nr:cyclic peptide export ABC transporter [Xanthobacteraceae bacterium]
MSFFQLVRREMQGSLTRLAVMSGLGGVSNAAILAAINAGAQSAGNGEVSVSAATLFVVALLLFIKTQHYILIATTVEIEAIIHKLRVRLMDEVRHSELLPLDAIGRAAIVAAITKETTTLTQATNMVAFAGQGVVLVFFVGIYIAYLSLLAFAVSVVVICVAGVIFHIKSRQVAAGTREAAEWDNRLFDRLIDLLDGFKEVRLNRSRSDDLFDDVVEVSRKAANIKIRSQSESYKQLVFSQSAMYLLLASVVFMVPAFSDTKGGSITQVTTALMFVVGVCMGIVQTIPILQAADVASDNIERLEAKLRAIVGETQVEPLEPRSRFDKIEMRDVVFSYMDKSSEAVFRVGPLNFTLHSGDIVFISGGNGSGKSTFLKLLAGLYEPDSGELLLDGVRVDDTNRDAYRALIAAIFVDYHLFQRLYGIADPGPGEINRLLTQFRLTDKTRLTGGEFSTLDLSGGQRKRLALIVSLLEKRPILLLDEWTADQDPDFRRKFYDELLPDLKQAGETVVVITHDDRYLAELDLPARKLRMDEGRFVGQDAVASG